MWQQSLSEGEKCKVNGPEQLIVYFNQHVSECGLFGSHFLKSDLGVAVVGSTKAQQSLLFPGHLPKMSCRPNIQSEGKKVEEYLLQVLLFDVAFFFNVH